jgi:nitroreductase
MYEDQRISDETRNLVIDAVRLAPSWKNLQPFFVVVVSERERLQKLKDACRGNPRGNAYENADCFLVLCSDPNIGAQYEGKDYSLVDGALAMQQAMLQATALGLGTCWIGAFTEQPVRELLGIPAHVHIVGLTPLGVPAETPSARPRRESGEMAFWQAWGRVR